MKKILVLLVFGATLMSCKTDAEKTTQANVTFYSKVWDVAINEGKIEVLDTAYSPKIVLHTSPEIKGVADAKAYYANFVTGFSNRQFIVKDMFGQGDKVTKYWQFKGKHTGTFMGIPATGKTVDIEGCTIARIVNGKIVEERDFMDNMSFLKQLGLIP
ncbi:MAG: hypothetical protein RLZZ231_362 [Bacteroidota bacterium]|jgi:steroid delta-isomerase-like uncharacterized protein